MKYARVTRLLVLVATLGSAFNGFIAEAARPAPSCDIVWSASERADLREGLSTVLARQNDFPVVVVTHYLKEHYADLNARINQVLGQTRDRLNSDINVRLGRMNEVNDRLIKAVTTIKSLLSAGRIMKLVRKAENTNEKVRGLVHEASFCRARGEVCAADLRRDLSAILRYHEELKTFAVRLDRELTEINLALQDQRASDPAVVSAIGRQRGSIVTSSLSIQTQLQAHRGIVDGLISAIDVFENQLEGSVRMLMVTAPGHTNFEGDLRDLLEHRHEKFNPKLELFKNGDAVFAINGSLVYPGHVLSAEADSKFLVKFETRSHGKYLTDATGMALAGCHFGLCTGDEMKIPSGILAALPLGKIPGEFPVTFRGPSRVLGFNPVTGKTLIVTYKGEASPELKGTVAWLDPLDLLALKEGSTPPSLRDQTEDLRDPQGRIGRWAYHFPDSSSKDDRARSAKPLQITSPSQLKGIKGSELAYVGCFGSFCSGENVTISLDRMESNPPTDPAKGDLLYRVKGYSPDRNEYILEYYSLNYSDTFIDSAVTYRGWTIWVAPERMAKTQLF